MAVPGVGVAVWGGGGGFTYDGKSVRKSLNRKTVDYNSSVVRYLQDRTWQRDYRDRPAVQPHRAYYEHMYPSSHVRDNPLHAVATTYVRSATNKFRCPIFALQWTPEGRRLVTGASSGEFTLWNGLTFNFETILQAHDVSVRSIMWSHNDLWMISCDNAGFVKYWQSNMNTVKMFQAHKDPIRDSSFSPNDSKMITCSDDSTVRVWDFLHCHEEQVLRGHGSDVKSCDWHPTKGLVVSGSRDSQQNVKLWDPKTGEDLCTLHGHKSTVTATKFNRNGNWLMTASRDHLLKLWDIRMMKEIKTYRGHKKEVHAVAWHPIHEDLCVSGGADGSLLFWMTNTDKEVAAIESAHDSAVWALAWHPLGHMLVSGSNDHSSKFWSRNRPGDPMTDRYNMANVTHGMMAGPTPTATNDEDDQGEEMDSTQFIPGMGEIVKGVSIPSDLITSHKTGESSATLRMPGRKDNGSGGGGRRMLQGHRRMGKNSGVGGGGVGGGGGSGAGAAGGNATGANQEPLQPPGAGFLSWPAGQNAGGKDLIDPLSVPPQVGGVLQLLKQQQQLLQLQLMQNQAQQQQQPLPPHSNHSDGQPPPPPPPGSQSFPVAGNAPPPMMSGGGGADFRHRPQNPMQPSPMQSPDGPPGNMPSFPPPGGHFQSPPNAAPPHQGPPRPHGPPPPGQPLHPGQGPPGPGPFAGQGPPPFPNAGPPPHFNGSGPPPRGPPPSDWRGPPPGMHPGGPPMMGDGQPPLQGGMNQADNNNAMSGPGGPAPPGWFPPGGDRDGPQGRGRGRKPRGRGGKRGRGSGPRP